MVLQPPRHIASRKVGTLLQLCPGPFDPTTLEFYRHREAGIFRRIQEEDNVITLFLARLAHSETPHPYLRQPYRSGDLSSLLDNSLG